LAKLKIGVLVILENGAKKELKKVHEFGLQSCQLSCWDPSCYTDAIADEVIGSCRKYGIEISTLWAGLPGTNTWNFTEGPPTIGLVPPETREMRIHALEQASNFAKTIGVDAVTTHVGFIPEWPGDYLYQDTVEALKHISQYCKSNNQHFCFETGQETPITLLRTIQDVGMNNLGINLDPANLLMYGKANPVDALDIIGEYVRNVHAKDGEYPVDGRDLGVEKPLGEGRVNFPVLVAKLKSLGYTGPLTIEREISGEEQIADIRTAIKILEPLC